MNKRKYLVSSLLFCATMSASDTVNITLLSPNQASKPTPIPTSNEISVLIGTSFLQARAQAIKGDSCTCSSLKEKTIEEQVFDDHISATQELYDISMHVKRNSYGNDRYVIIESYVYGAPEDFKNQNILKYEDGLLKSILIRKYLEEKSKFQESDKITSLVIDAQTKVVKFPEFCIRTIKDSIFSFREREETCKDRMGMCFVTIFPMNEFNELMKKYLDEPAKEEPKIEETSTKNAAENTVTKTDVATTNSVESEEQKTEASKQKAEKQKTESQPEKKSGPFGLW